MKDLLLQSAEDPSTASVSCSASRFEGSAADSGKSLNTALISSLLVPDNSSSIAKLAYCCLSIMQSLNVQCLVLHEYLGNPRAGIVGRLSAFVTRIPILL